MVKATRRYSAKLKLQVVLETLSGEKTQAQIGKAYEVHANTVGLWKKTLLERGLEIFQRGGGTCDLEQAHARLVGDLRG